MVAGGSEATAPLLADASSFAKETPAQRKARHRSLWTIYLTNFLSAVGFSILLSTMWPFLEKLGGSKSFLGLLVGAFSLGQLIGSPFWGYWTDHYRYIITLQISTLLRFVGNIMYAVADNVDGPKDWFLLEARLIVGFAAGSMAVCTTYASGATTPEERTGALSMLAASGGLGFIFGPLIGVAFGKLEPGVNVGSFEFTYLTAPAYFAALTSLLNMLLLWMYFKEYRIMENTELTTGSLNDDGEVVVRDTSRDNVAVWSLLLMFFGNFLVLSIFETIGTPLTMDEYGWNPQQADIFNGVIAGVYSVESVIMYILSKKLAAYFGERKLLIIGFLLTVVGQAGCIPIAGSHPEVWQPTNDDDDATRTGCQGDWCDSQPKLPFWQYLLASFFVNLGYPVASVMLFTLYSKVLSPYNQGVWMGILNSFGSLARGVGPLYITWIYSSYGPRFVYATAAGVTLIITLIGWATYKRLVPHRLQRGAP